VFVWDSDAKKTFGKIWVVYHLHGETDWFTVKANGKQKP